MPNNIELFKMSWLQNALILRQICSTFQPTVEQNNVIVKIMWKPTCRCRPSWMEAWTRCWRCRPSCRPPTALPRGGSSYRPRSGTRFEILRKVTNPTIWKLNESLNFFSHLNKKHVYTFSSFIHSFSAA